MIKGVEVIFAAQADKTRDVWERNGFLVENSTDDILVVELDLRMLRYYSRIIECPQQMFDVYGRVLKNNNGASIDSRLFFRLW